MADTTAQHRTTAEDLSVAFDAHLQPDTNEYVRRAGPEDTTLDSGHPRPWHTPMATMSLKLWRQLLVLNPFDGSYFGLYRSLRSPRDKAIACCGALFAIAAGIPLPIIGVIFGRIISAFPPDEDELHTRIVQLLAVAVAYFAVTTVYTISFSRTGERIAIRLREQLMEELMYVDQAYLDVEDLDYNGLLRDQIDTIQVGCSEKVGIFLQSISYFVAAFTVGFILNAKLTGILFAAIIPSMTFIVTAGSMSISKLTRRILQHTERASAIALSSLRAVPVVQAFDIIDHLCTRHEDQLDESSSLGIRKAIASALELGGAYFTAYAANAVAFYVGSHMTAAGETGGNAGTIYAVVFLILDASFVVGQFAPFLEIFAKSASAHSKIRVVLEICPTKTTSARTPSVAHLAAGIRGEAIRIENVSFCYPARPDVQVLDRLTMQLQPNAFNAIVGSSGGGKSTLLSLLLGLYDYSGKIYIGSRELRDLDVHHLRSQIAVLDQDCVLFSGTIYDNICYGLSGQIMDQEKQTALCDEAVNAAGVDFLSDLPHGIHTRIDNTLQLSGGQRQRICLARALISQPAMLVLDEPTSALDARSEVKVMDAIQSAVAKGLTVMMIAHRLSTVLSADRIVVIQDGRAIEQGHPTELTGEGTALSGLLAAQNTNNEAPTHRFTSEESSMAKSSKSSLADSAAQDPRGTDQSNEKVDPNMRTAFGHFLNLTRPDHTIIGLGILASSISGAMIIGEAIIFGNLVQLLNTDKASPNFQSEADFFCLMFFVLACIALLSFVGSGTAFGIASARMITRVRVQLLRHVLSLDLAWFSGATRSAAELSSTFAKDSSDLACLSGVALGTIFTVLVSVCGGIILAHAVAWKIAIVLLGAVPIMILSGFIRLRLLAKSESRHRFAYGDATSFAVEACHGRRTVTILRLEAQKLQRYHEALQKPYREGLVPTILINSLLALSFAITYFVYALAYWWGSKQVRNGTYTQQDFFTVLPALLFSAQSAGQLFALSPEIARAKTAAMSIFQLLSFQPSILQPPSDRIDKPPSHANLSSDDNRKIEFRSVDFSYSTEHNSKVLDDVCLTVWDGETVALVGPSGAGKSSIMALIERLYDPTAGQILFDGKDMLEHDIREIRNRMALLSQNPDLFPGSIEYNIRLGCSDHAVTQDEIERVAVQCGIHEFITSLPEGYGTECGSVANSQLSGGQRQRVALARALIRKPEVLLLDEPTSALDAHSERHIQDALQVASRGRTTIIVAHRLASIRHADKIIVLEGGKVVEQGTHVELVQQGGLYASMAQAQALA